MSNSARHIEDLIAEAVERRLTSRLDELHDAIHKLRSEQEATETKRGDLVEGLDPYGLYSVSSVADRWDVSNDWVRELDEDKLPRAEWPGRDIRYRGHAVLQAEQILVDVIPIHRIGSTETPARPARTTGKRPYAKNLPSIS